MTPVMYSLVWCFLAQLHQFTTTQSPESLDSMQEAERCLKRWAECGNDRQGIEGGLRAKASPFMACTQPIEVAIGLTPRYMAS